MLFNIPFFIERIVSDSGREFVPFLICQNLFDLVLCSPFKAPEHFLFPVLQNELEHAVFKLIIAVLLVIRSINSSAVIKNRDFKMIIRLQIRFFRTLDILLNDQAFKRPVLDLHRIRIVINEMIIIDLCHIRD